MTSDQQEGTALGKSYTILRRKDDLPLAAWRGNLVTFLCTQEEEERGDWQSLWSFCCFWLSLLWKEDNFKLILKNKHDARPEGVWLGRHCRWFCGFTSSRGCGVRERTAVGESRDERRVVVLAFWGGRSHEDSAGVCWELTAQSEAWAQSGGAGPHANQQQTQGDAQSRVQQ